MGAGPPHLPARPDGDGSAGGGRDRLVSPSGGRRLRALLAVEDVAQDPAGTSSSDGHPGPADTAAEPEIRVRHVLTKAKHRLAHRAYHTNLATVYLLGQVGAALLREMGLTSDLRPCKEVSPVAQAHSLCLLDVILLGLAEGKPRCWQKRSWPTATARSCGPMSLCRSSPTGKWRGGGWWRSNKPPTSATLTGSSARWSAGGLSLAAHPGLKVCRAQS